MFEAKEEYTAAVDRAFAIVKKHGIGVDIPTAEIEAALGVTRSEAQWVNLRRRLGARVREEMNTRLDSVVGNTLRALTNDDLHNWYPQKQWKRRWRSTSRQKWALEHVDVRKLSDHQRRKLQIQREELAMERRRLRQEKNAITRAVKDQSNPRRAAKVTATLVRSSSEV